MEKYLALLGYVVRDRVTGFEGTATSVCFDLYGCVQIAVNPLVDSSKPSELGEGRWFDEKRLVKAGKKPVMEQPTFEVIPGPSSKPAFRSSPLG